MAISTRKTRRRYQKSAYNQQVRRQVGQALQVARQCKGESQLTVAKSLGVPQTLISEIERGKLLPPDIYTKLRTRYQLDDVETEAKAVEPSDGYRLLEAGDRVTWRESGTVVSLANRYEDGQHEYRIRGDDGYYYVIRDTSDRDLTLIPRPMQSVPALVLWNDHSWTFEQVAVPEDTLPENLLTEVRAAWFKDQASSPNENLYTVSVLLAETGPLHQSFLVNKPALVA